MGKIKSIRVPSDDCVVNVGRRTEGDRIIEPGEPCNAHKGEWVDLLPVMSLETYLAAGSLALVASDDGKTSEEKVIAVQGAA
ncbi:hypothetical protein LCGC14_1504980, partial [marine sediment metagenome]